MRSNVKLILAKIDKMLYSYICFSKRLSVTLSETRLVMATFQPGSFLVDIVILINYII